MGERGPVPKRSTQRRRTNKQEEPTKAPASETVERPEPEDKWHPVAKRWYESLKESGQSAFYQSSDWATAYLLAESISRDLKPQVVGISEETNEPVLATIPLKGASLSAYLKAMTMLLVTEGDRRRAGLELQVAQQPAEPSRKGVSNLADYRARLSG